MKKLIYSDVNACVGCNRCTRSCPVEMANVVFMGENGEICVDIDHEKCIACGACINACKHGAREYVDDVERFINDLRGGKSISLIVAPAIRSNINETGRLFAWLRKLGVKKIYDVSVGADICTWAHIRYIQKHNTKSLITQPCPVIVNYCIMYQPKLLQYLSPVHSPMLCAAIYMRQYERISTPIAAISPCIAKTHEFESTDCVQYNVTFKKLLEYIQRNNIELPRETSDFDHAPSGLGSVYSMPGGLKENVEFFLGKGLRIDKSEGQSVVYSALDSFAQQPIGRLPNIFDVLNCAEGCNAGTGCVHNRDIFETNTAMEQARKNAINGRDREYFEALYEGYDRQLRLEHFLRKYTPMPVRTPAVTEADIEKAMLSMGKETEVKRNFDCRACGSSTCADMARKIALRVNVPDNCIQKNRDEIKSEHATLVDIQRDNMKNIEQISVDIGNIKEYADAIAGNIKNVNCAVEEYSSMAKIINDIAMQISIISMNASIEAARAGVHGKTFAVIAGEIQNLARTSKETVSKSDAASSAAGKSVKDMNGITERILAAVETADNHIQKINNAHKGVL